MVMVVGWPEAATVKLAERLYSYPHRKESHCAPPTVDRVNGIEWLDQ